MTTPTADLDLEEDLPLEEQDLRLHLAADLSLHTTGDAVADAVKWTFKVVDELDKEVARGRLEELDVTYEPGEENEHNSFLMDSISEEALQLDTALRAHIDDLDTVMGLVHLEVIRVAADRRGQGIGRLVVRRLAEHFARGAPMVSHMIVKATPLPDSGGAHAWRTEDPAAFAAAERRLFAFYAACGFQRLGDTDVFCLNLQEKLPDLDN